MKTVDLVKCMSKEELVDMIVQIKNFKNPVTGKRHHKLKMAEDHWADKWSYAKQLFNMNNFDFVDALINNDGGYVRYCGASYQVIEMLKQEFGFEEE